MAQVVNRAPYVKNLKLVHQGKVRDLYELPKHFVPVLGKKTKRPVFYLMVATDAVSTHNVVHLSSIPDKGQILTAMQIAWMLGPLQHIPNHIAAFRLEIYKYLPGERADYPPDLHLRSIVVYVGEVVPIEFIFRARMAGSLWTKFYKEGIPNPYELDLPTGLRLMSPFLEPIFTPTDKSDTDDERPSDDVEAEFSEETAFARRIYEIGRTYALTREIDIIDFKCEVGSVNIHQDSPCLMDEWLTPDCCRFVDAKGVVIGQEPKWKDKQIVRDEAERVWGNGPKVPLILNPFVIDKTREAYHEVMEQLFGMTLFEFQEMYLQCRDQPINFARRA